MAGKDVIAAITGEDDVGVSGNPLGKTAVASEEHLVVRFWYGRIAVSTFEGLQAVILENLLHKSQVLRGKFGKRRLGIIEKRTPL